MANTATTDTDVPTVRRDQVDAVTLCAASRCLRAAAWGPFCADHRTGTALRVHEDAIVAVDLSDAELERLRALVEAEAAALFPVALGICLAHNLRQASPHSRGAPIIEPAGTPPMGLRGKSPARAIPSLPDGHTLTDAGVAPRCPCCAGSGIAGRNLDLNGRPGAVPCHCTLPLRDAP